MLSSASLRAVPAQLRVLLGRNGQGKSTLLRIAAGYTEPDTGTVRWDGQGSLGWSALHLGRLGVFFLADHDLLSPAFSIRRQFAMFERQFGGMRPEDAAEQVGVKAQLDKKPFELSGGELRRAELACALVRQPRVLLADEPYRGISPLDAERLTEVFRSMASNGVAVIVTGHEVPTLMAAADHITWCTSGTTYELGAPEAARSHERFREGYLGASSGGGGPGRPL